MKSLRQKDETNVSVATRELSVNDLPSVSLLMLVLLVVLLISGLASGI